MKRIRRGVAWIGIYVCLAPVLPFLLIAMAAEQVERFADWCCKTRPWVVACVRAAERVEIWGR